MHVPDDSFPASPYREKRQAKLILGKMKRNEVIAGHADRYADELRQENTPISEVVLGRARRFRAQYERSTGIKLDSRREAETALKAIAETGRARVSEVLARFAPDGGDSSPPARPADEAASEI